MKNFTRFVAAGLFVVLLLAGCADREEAEPDLAADMAEQHQNDRPDASIAVQEPRIPVRARSVTYGTGMNGDSLTGYMATPVRPDSVAESMGMAPGDTSLPALIIIHEWWGLNDNIRTMARRLAGEGFRVLAVDLYGGEVGTTPQEAQSIMGQALENPDALQANTRAAYQYLTERYDAPKVRVLGWCFGGMMALRTALDMPTDLEAAVIYYGQIGDVGRDQLETLQMPILAFFGAEDTSIPVQDVRQFESTLDDLGKDASVYVYDNAGHAFANPSGRNYVEDAAADAWDKTTTFLKRTLYDQQADSGAPADTTAGNG